MSRKARVWGLVAIGLGVMVLGVVAWCRGNSAAAELYARRVYPGWSAAVSRLTAWVPVSLEETLAVGAAAAAIACLCRLRRRWLSLIAMLVWLTAWFYGGWGINYFRSSVFERAGVMPAAFDAERFGEFLTEYTDSLNNSYLPIEEIDRDLLEKEIKGYYGRLPERWGLARPKAWQRPKRLLFTKLYSGVGVLGFVGPFFNEIQINGEVPPVQYPFTYAHELSHLLGVSSEAEANYWAWKACTASAEPAFRYAGLQSLLPYVYSNARRALPAEQFSAWADSLRPEVVRALQTEQDYWAERYSPFIGRIQSRIYDLYLKGNNIPSGTANYNEVIQIILSVDQR